MKLRLFLDEDVHAGLASALRKRGYNVVHAVEAERLGVSDQEQLTFAATDRRCLVTFNVGDFVQLHRRWTEKGQGHAGLIVSKQLVVGQFGCEWSAEHCSACGWTDFIRAEQCSALQTDPLPNN